MDQHSSTQTSQEPVKITITFPTNAYFMSGIRDFTFSMVKNMTSFSEKWAYRFQSVIDELCNNAIEYGSAPLKEIKVVFLYRENESLEIIVEDTGTGKSKMKAGDLQKFVEERIKPNFPFTELRGRGLTKIVAEWTDELEFKDLENGGLQVRAKKHLKDEKNAPIQNKVSDPTRIMLTF